MKGPIPAGSDLLTYAEAAAVLGVNRSRVNAIVAAGGLATVRLDGRTVRVTRASLDAYQLRRRGAGRPPRPAAEE